jgi:hypothetical protein
VEDVLVVIWIRYIAEVLHDLWVVFDPAQYRVIDTVADAPLDPLHSVGLLGLDDGDAITSMCR